MICPESERLRPSPALSLYSHQTEEVQGDCVMAAISNPEGTDPELNDEITIDVI